MKPEAASYLAKAREDLSDAQKILAAGLSKAAARSAYYAMFHLAEAYIFERSEKVAKTHSGVRAEVARLSRDEPGFDPTFREFLAKSYKYKEIADYGVGAGDVITLADAEGGTAAAVRKMSGSPCNSPARRPSLDVGRGIGGKMKARALYSKCSQDGILPCHSRRPARRVLF